MTSSTEIWKSIGNPFYSMFFALQWSALLLWEKGIFSWENELHTIVIISILILLFVYYIFDWYDANLAPDADKDIKVSDIFLWCLSVLLLAIIIFLYIKKDDKNSFWEVSIPIYIGWFYTIMVIILRDRYLSKIQEVLFDQKKKKSYKKLEFYSRFRVFLIIYYLVLLTPPIIFLTVIHHRGINNDLANEQMLQGIFNFENYYWCGLLFLIFIPSLILKIYRNKNVLRLIIENNSL